MVHARLPAPLAHRLIQRVAGRLRPEHLAIAGTKALDRRLVEQGFGRGEQGQRLGGPQAALVGGVETADASDLVADEIEAQARLLAGGEQVDEADRKCVVEGKSVSVRVDLGGRRVIKKKQTT